MTTETTERDLVTEVESLLNDVGFRGDFETVSRPLLRRLVEEVQLMRAAFKGADGLAQINAACWDSTAADSRQSEELLLKIAQLADIGSAEEFNDGLERLRTIRTLLMEGGVISVG